MLTTCLRSFAVSVLLALGLPVAAQSLQLADGRVLLAKVEDADGSGLRVRRLDNGGSLELRWDHLSPASALAIKKQFSLAGDNNEQQQLVRADEVEYVTSGSRQFVIGRIVDRGSDPILVVSKGRQYPISRKDLVAVRTVEVPVMQVYTKDEYYNDRKAALQPGDKADVHMLLAEDLLKVGDYDRCLEHLDTAKKLGNSLNPGQIDSLMARAQKYKDAAKEARSIEEIEAARTRATVPDFAKGLTMIAQFEKDYPQSKLKAEFEAEKKRFTAARTRFLTLRIAEAWRSTIAVVADKKVSDASVTLEAAREYATTKMSDDIVAKLVANLHLEADEIKTLWAARKGESKGKKSELFSYGLGSWVIGEEAILKNTTAGKEKEKQDPNAANDAQNQRDIQNFMKAMQQALKNRAQAGQGQGAGGGADAPKTEEDWWRASSRQDRAGWLRAYYAENSGQLTVTSASLTPCPACYAEGTRVDQNAEGKVVRVPCYLCQKTKWLRSFRAW